MSLRDRMAALFRAPSSRAPCSIPTGPVTPLAASAPFEPSKVPPPPPHPDLALVMNDWRIRGGTWPDFIKALEHSHRFHLEERTAREAKLAALQATPRFVP